MAARTEAENLRIGLGRMGLVAMSLQDFAALIIVRVRGGGGLDDNALEEIKRQAIDNLKNSSSRGMPLDQEAEIFGKAIGDLEALIDGAITRGQARQ